MLKSSSANSYINMRNEPFIQPPSIIKIVEIADASVSNPQPSTGSEKSYGEFISVERLRDISGVTDLNNLRELKLKIVTTETSIGNLGSIAPNLEKLNLNNSYITSVRDLGTSLNKLTTLWLSRCCIAELDGVSCIAALQELYVAYNEIFDLSPLSMLENLEVLDLEGNNVDDITQVEFLSLCSKLSTLTLKGNPLEKAPTPTSKMRDLKFYSYKDAVLESLPQLQQLDDESFLVEIIDGKAVKRVHPRSTNNIYDADLKIVQDSLKAVENDESSDQSDSESSTSRPLSARMRCQSAKVALRNVEDTSFASHNRREITPQFLKEDHCSKLTHGQIMCGNPVRALRRRNKDNTRGHVSVRHDKPQRIFQPEHTYLEEDENAGEKDDILQELKEWRMKNRSLFEQNSQSSSVGAMYERNSSQPKLLNSTPSPTLSPTPPSKARTKRLSPVNRQSLPTLLPKHGEDNRPHTAADFRSRRYRGASPDLAQNLASSVNPFSCIDETVDRSCQVIEDDVMTKRPETRAALQLSRSKNTSSSK
ncbi:leucine-rich repeat-containing protein 56-like isoform X2 [Hydractinia symbiolongicarpus]|uniref:leucine-rich repeat-containing protein 56-like isoform X2 n=1 Tax=Hydractinia symbiolongicarpus TaxID=13093 RepID=UPI00254D1172|nr:leucine-rich repeat-containing protein 56-like isoform X2 [Hydractinia symbiolongicarpus]